MNLKPHLRLAVWSATFVIAVGTVQADLEVPYTEFTNSIPTDEGEVLHEFALPPTPAGARPAPAEAPALFNDFLGTTNNLYTPPDTMGAVGTNRLMIMINGEVRIQDRSGAVISSTSLNAFWSGAGSYSDNPGRFVFDPHVVYDPYSHRWLATAAANPGSLVVNGQILIGVSVTSDPSGAWYQYAYDVDTSRVYFGDYPLLGFNKDKVVVTFTFAYVTNGVTLPNAGIFVFDKNALYSGTTPPYFQGFFETTFPNILQPAYMYDTNIGSVFLVGTLNNSSVRLYSLTGPATNIAVSTAGTATASAWSRRFNSDTAGQKGTTVRLNAGDDRMHQAVYRNGAIWCAHTICLPSSNPNRSAVQFWQMTTNGSVTQQGIIQDSTARTNYAFPSIAVNRFGDAMIGCASFSTNHYPSAAYTAQSPLDARGSFQSMALLKAGLTNYWYTDGANRNRWGDYSATQVDPVNDTDFWTLQEYAVAFPGAFTSTSGRWSLWWGRLALPAPANDHFTNVDTLAGTQGSIAGTTLRATRETGEPNHAAVSNSPSVWYNWTAFSNAVITLDISANTANMLLAVYTGNAVGALSLVTNSSALPPKVTFSVLSNTTYRIAVAGSAGAQGNFTLGWLQPSAPLFLLQPQTTNAIIGETIPLTSTAIGTPNPAYQWRRAGTNLPNATNSSLVITNIQTADGTNYYVVATNTTGATTSAVANVFVWPDSSSRLLSAQMFTNRQFVFAVAGLTNRPYRIETSTNLSSATNWVTIYTNYVTYIYTNFATTNDAQRFYRAITN